MTISLPDDLTEQLQQWVRTGGYSDPIAVIRDAFELLEAQDRDILERREEILAALERGRADYRAGRISNKTGFELLAEIEKKREAEGVSHSCPT